MKASTNLPLSERFLYRLPEIFFGVVGVVAAALGALIYVTHRANAREWEAFRVAHRCVEVGEVAPSTGIGVGYAPSTGKGSGGVVVVPVFTPGKRGWKCDDGKTYWRDE